MRITEWDYHIADFLQLTKTFIDESALNLTYNQARSMEYLYSLINDAESAIFIQYHNDKPVGGAIANASREFHDEALGYLVKMYVLPEARGTTVGRSLAQEITDWFDHMGCVMSYASATAAIGQDKAFINLLGKYGFKPNGEVLIRQLGN